MANSAARLFLKSGKSFPQLLRNPVVSRSSTNVSKDQQILQSLINQTHKFYIQQSVFGSRFNFVGFDLEKNGEFSVESWKFLASPVGNFSRLEARKGRQWSDDDDDDDFSDYDPNDIDFDDDDGPDDLDDDDYDDDVPRKARK